MMSSRKNQTVDRPFPDENTVAEMYCNEAYTLDNEAVEDWSSSLQMLLTFASIFSAVLITLIVDSKMLLRQDNTDVLVDAVVFLMNNLANGTHRPYEPPKFQPSPKSIAINCLFFSSLCLSIATALAAVLAMQWVTDYGAVTRRAGSTPEERVKRRHFRYQGGQDWKMDTIIGALPIALHLSVLLFYVGLIVWMWDVHHSVFGVVFVCGVVAALFYIVTTALAIFYASCPYRTPLASWIYRLLHFIISMIPHLPWFASRQKPDTEDKRPEKMEEGKETSDQRVSWLRELLSDLHSRFAQASLSLRDDVYLQSPDKTLMKNSLIWLSNHISISPEVHHRLLVLINGFTSVIGDLSDSSVKTNVPWRHIFHVLGLVYKSFVQSVNFGEDDFAEFARQAHCLSAGGLKEILDSGLGSEEEVTMESSDFPLRLLHAWVSSTSSHTSDALRKQRFSDEVVVHSCLNDICSTPRELCETWYALLKDESKTCDRILPQLLHSLYYSPSDRRDQMLNTTLYVISTGALPWGTESNPLVRRMQAAQWVDNLPNHQHQAVILQKFSEFKWSYTTVVLPTQNKLTDEDGEELKRMGWVDAATRWIRPEEILYSILTLFDGILINAGNGQQSTSKQDMETWMIIILGEDLVDANVRFSSDYFGDRTRKPKADALRRLSNPVLRLIGCATLGIQWDPEWVPELDQARSDYSLWRRVTKICFKDPPLVIGDCTVLWQLRLQLWTHFESGITSSYLYSVIDDLNRFRRVEQEISYSRIEINYGDDFLLALFHLNYAYGWESPSSPLVTYIPDILMGSASSTDDAMPYSCIDYLISVCQRISSDPLRLIRLLIELIRADINHLPEYRRPKTLLGLLEHAKTHLSTELRPYSPSCRRLTRYIKESYKQFEENWLDNDDSYRRVDRTELKTVCEEVVTLLNPTEPWEGEETDISWPVHLLRPTGTKGAPFKDEVEKETESQNVVGDGRGEAEQSVHDEQGAKEKDVSMTVQGIPSKEVVENELEPHSLGQGETEQPTDNEPKSENGATSAIVPVNTNEEK